MRRLRYMIAAICSAALLACSDLDLNPKDEAATGNWFQTPEQFEMNLNVLLLHMFWPQERLEWTGSNQCALDAITDDFTNRDKLLSFTNGSLNSTNPVATAMWDNTYTAINRCNKIITELHKVEAQMDPELRNRILGNARFYRACFYARLLMHFGDVVVVDENIDIESEEGRNAAYLLERTDRWSVLEDVLEEFDDVVEMLPREYSASEVQRATKGAAYGMKARTALHFASIRKWDTYGLGNPSEAERLFGIAAEAAKNCMDLNVYKLHDSFPELFLQSTKNSPEGIFVIPRSKAYSNGSLRQYLNGQSVTVKLTRTPVGTNALGELPSWDLLCSFLCTDGLPIDESPLYDPSEPFKNRDPRCSYTIVEFGTQHLGYEFNPRLDVAEIYSSKEGKMVTNNDSRTYLISGNSNQYASYNGLALKKGIDESWLSPYETEPDKRILRYADVLLMYAEASLEAGDKPTAIKYLDMVRTRGDNMPSVNDTYPQGITENQLREIIRRDRRIELAFEDKRWWDILRWKICDGENGVMNKPIGGMKIEDTNGDGVWEYNYHEVGKRTFLPRMYYQPIPQYVIDKNPVICEQNGGEDGWVNGQNPGY